jgi:hypothetical protein
MATRRATRRRRYPNIKIECIAQDRTLRSLARSARVPEVRLSDIHRGVGAPPTDREQKRIAKALNRSVADLFGSDDSDSAAA